MALIATAIWMFSTGEGKPEPDIEPHQLTYLSFTNLLKGESCGKECQLHYYKKCEPYYKDHCETFYKNHCEEYYEEKCEYEMKEHCEYTYEE